MEEKKYQLLVETLLESIGEKNITISMLRYDAHRLGEKLKAAEKTIEEQAQHLAEIERNGEF